MLRCQRGELVELDPEIERTCEKSAKTINFNTTNKISVVFIDKTKEEDPRYPPLPPLLMAENRMEDYTRSSITGTKLGIERQAVDTNNLEIKPNIIQIAQTMFNSMCYPRKIPMHTLPTIPSKSIEHWNM